MKNTAHALRATFCAILIGAALSACGGGSSAVPNATGTSAPSSSPKPTASPTPSPTPTPVRTPSMIYVACRNSGPGQNGAILGFSLKSSGNVTPAIDISGNNTQFLNPTGLAMDAAGRLYVTNDISQGNTVFIFAPGANGNVAPAATISGSNTALQGANGIALDPSGNLWVADWTANSVFEFAAGQTGNIAPIRTIAGASTQLNHPSGIGVDASGNVYVGESGSVIVFAPGASGNVAPTLTMADPAINSGLPRAIAFNSSGSIAVVSENIPGVYIYPSGDNGSSPATQAITGSATGFAGFGVEGVAFDAQGNIYAGDYISWTSGSLSEFAASASGNAAPIWSVSGSNTLIAGAEEIVVR